MKALFTLTFATLLFIAGPANAQDQDTVSNGDFEQWHLKEFLKCCGRNIDIPWYWGISEQLTGLNYNKFTFMTTDSANVHSGLSSIELFSDTTYLNNLVLVPGTVAYGAMTDSASTAVTIGPVIQSTGFPLDGRPYSLNFYMQMSHQVTDTPYYFYVFTKWDTTGQKEDTLAYSGQVDIPDNPQTMNQWVLYTNTVQYLMPGTPDTAQIMFFGGRFGNPRLQGNATYLDDVSFYYLSSGLVSLDGGPVLEVYPNPTTDMLTVKTGEYQPGNEFRIYDALGQCVKTVAIESYSTVIGIHTLAAGNYFYRLTDSSETFITQGKFVVIR